MTPPLKGEALETAIDLRLHDLWGDTVGWAELGDLDAVGAIMRAAYARGYVDAVKDGGKFMRDELGYPLPAKDAV